MELAQPGAEAARRAVGEGAIKIPADRPLLNFEVADANPARTRNRIANLAIKQACPVFGRITMLIALHKGILGAGKPISAATR